MKSNFNICTASDSYKMCHHAQFPDGTEKVYSYFESRCGAEHPTTVFFGLQYIIKKYLAGAVVTEEGIEIAKRRINAHLFDGAFNEAGWRYILDEYDGKLPIKISAVPEGMGVATNNVLMTVENTDPKCYWLTNYLETILTHVWAPSTVATVSYHAKQMMSDFLFRTSDNPEAIDFMLHDFGARGVTSFGSAEITGAGHLISFMGTDTFPAIDTTMDYYNAPEVTGYSVPASEHSLMCSLGRDGEMEVLKNLLDKYPTGILSVVIDSYDYREFIKNAYINFKDEILARDGKLVFRPDSGQPNEVTVDVYNLLEERFGSTTNSKGFKVLNPKVGILWGDGIDVSGIRSVLFTLELRGISADNMVFGMGGGLLQKMNRDTQRFAFKSSYQERNGVGYDIYKQPIDVSKASKKGKLMLIRNVATNELETVPWNATDDAAGLNLLEPVFENGELLRDMSFSDVRNNSENK